MKIFSDCKPPVFIEQDDLSYVSCDVYVPGRGEEEGEAKVERAEAGEWPPSVDGRAVVLIHGGLWTERDKSGLAEPARLLARKLGVAVIVPNYVLNRPWPGALDTLWQVVKWALAELQVKDVAFVGHSVGGHMAAQLPLALGDEEVWGGHSLASLTKAVIGVQGMYDLRTWAQLRPGDAIELAVTFPDGPASFVDPMSVEPTPTTLAALRTAATHFLLVHAPGDTLVETTQATRFAHHLVATHSFPPSSVVHVTSDIPGSHDDAIAGLASPRTSTAGAALLAVLLPPLQAAFSST
jgi:acetyl esterase/lipase